MAGENLFIGSLIVFTMLLVYILMVNMEQPKTLFLFDEDEPLTKRELGLYVDQILEARDKKPPKYKKLINQIILGFVSGLITGLLLSGWKSGVLSGIAMAVVNPLMTTLESSV